MLEKLKQEVCQANLLLPKYNLVTFTWGNVSGIDRSSGYVVIKPSGVEYAQLTPESMVVVDLEGNVVDGELKPSSDTPTHLELYKHFFNIGGVVHTHSSWAVSFAQAGSEIPCAGTTHGDYFYGSIPVTRNMSKQEIEKDYEKETGNVIIETFKQNSINPVHIPGVLVNDHGPFTWGDNPVDAIHNSVVLEKVAEITYHSMQINSKNIRISRDLLDKHFLRKHGKEAYYGQN